MISVLYVDPDARMREEVCTFLQTDPAIRVEAFVSAHDALDLVREHRFDAIVSESHLPVTDGQTFLEVLRQGRKETTPFIFFAKKSSHSEAIRALNSGATYYLLKGNNPEKVFPVLRHYIMRAVEQHRIKEELEKSENRYRCVVEDQSDFIVRFQPDKKLVFANGAYRRHVSLGEDELPFGQNDLFLQNLQHLSPEHPTSTLETSWILPDGRVEWQNWGNRAIFDEKGHVIEYQSVGRDITEQKTTEFALREALRNLGIMNSITRHDILNQLTGIFGYLEYCLHTSPDPKIRESLSKALQAAETMKAQILFTRDYQEIGNSAPRWQNMDQVFSRAVGTLNLAGIRVECGLEDLWVYADPLIEKVFFNLLENSLRHGERVSIVRVYSRESNEGLTIVYEDDGAGVPPDAKEKIFRREYFQNTGLGLYLSREILAITRMEIRETGTVGEGARFEINVPKGGYGRRVQELPV
jgi:signal transduction histidine kinase/FixJ family two-component response regulator